MSDTFKPREDGVELCMKCLRHYCICEYNKSKNEYEELLKRTGEANLAKKRIAYLLKEFQTPKGNIITEALMKFENERLER